MFEPMHVMAADNDRVGQPSIPLEFVVHNATVILSGVLFGALLTFITSQLGRLRHHVTLVNRLFNMITIEHGLLLRVFIFSLPLWCIWACPKLMALTRFLVPVKEKARDLFMSLASRVPLVQECSIHRRSKSLPQVPGKADTVDIGNALAVG